MTSGSAEAATAPASPVRVTPPLREWLERVEAITGAVRQHDRPGSSLPGLRTLADAQWLADAGLAALAQPREDEAAFVPLMLAAGLWRKAGGGPDRALRDHRAYLAARAFDRRFGADTPAAGIATVHHASCRLPKDDLEIVRSSDFVLGPGTPVGHLPCSLAVPYAFDLPAREMLATLHVTLSGLLGEPFLYAAQRDRARLVARIPFASLPELYGPPDRTAAPVLIFSLGRTGSTLLQKLIACVTPRAVSEPDLLTQLARDSGVLAQMSAQERTALIHYAVAPFSRLRVARAKDGRCVIKLRSQVNLIADQIAGGLPCAKYIFMVRERRAWARSTYRAYGSKASEVVDNLVSWLHDLDRLQRCSVDLSIVSYEDVVADPHATVRRLTGADPARNPLLYQRVSGVARTDSQASHILSRERLAAGRSDEAAWLACFDKFWAERRPGGLLARLGVRI